MRFRLPSLPLLTVLGATCALAGPALAQSTASPRTLSLFPTRLSEVPSSECPHPSDEAAAPAPSSAVKAAARIDEALIEAARDLGVTPEQVGPPPSGDDLLGTFGTADVRSRVLVPELIERDGRLELRLSLVPPKSKVAIVRTQPILLDQIDLRAAVMLRDVLNAADALEGSSSAPTAQAAPSPPPPPAAAATQRSEGRAPLALNIGALGGYVGWTLQRTSGSSDARLTYPLVAIGAGAGLAATMVVADEWDVSTGDAWFLSAGIWWPMSSAILLADAYRVHPPEDRFAYGLLGATAGLALGATTLSSFEIDEGGALITHSGGAFGMVFGGLTQLVKRGSTAEFPSRGTGFGAGIGVLGAGMLATQVQVEPSRVVFIDLSAGLGGLVGAAAGSPLLLVDEEEEAWRTRGWLAAIGAGILGGGIVGYFLTESSTADAATNDAAARAWPFVGPLGVSGARSERDAPLVGPIGAGLQGVW